MLQGINEGSGSYRRKYSSRTVPKMVAPFPEAAYAEKGLPGASIKPNGNGAAGVCVGPKQNSRGGAYSGARAVFCVPMGS